MLLLMVVIMHSFILILRYKGDISSEQREALLGLLRFQSHESITPEVRRELQHAKCRDLEDQVPKMDET